MEVYRQFPIFGVLCEDHREMFDFAKKLPYPNKMYSFFQNREKNDIQRLKKTNPETYIFLSSCTQLIGFVS